MKKLICIIAAIAVMMFVFGANIHKASANDLVDDAVICSEEDPNEPAEDIAE